MKKWILPLVCLLAVCVLCACKPSSDWSVGDISDQEFTDALTFWSVGDISDQEFTDALTLRVTQIDREENRVTYEISNNSEVEYGYGTSADFMLEMLKDGKWYKLRHSTGWDVTAEECIVKPGETKEHVTSLMGELSPGTYRLVKAVCRRDDYRSTEYVCGEFTIE